MKNILPLDSSFKKLLKASEDRFQEIIEKTPAGVCITNEKGIYEYVNDAYCKIYGYRADELLGKHFTIVIPKEYKSKLIELHDHFLSEKTEIRGEWEVLDKKGEKLFILADAAYIIDKDNKPKKVTFVINITERKNAENQLENLNKSLEQKVSERTSALLKINEQLNNNKKHLIEAQKIARMGSWEWNIKSDIINWSEEVYKIFEIDPVNFEATFDNYQLFVHKDDLSLLNDKVTMAMKNLEPYELEHRVVTPNGNIKFVYAKGKIKVDEEGNPTHLFGIVQDITDKKRIEAEIQMLSDAIEESINIIFITDKTGSLIYVNKSFETVTGYLRNEILGQNPRLFSTGHASIETYKSLWETIQSGNTWHGELKNKKKNGEIFWVNSTILPIRSETGDVIKFMAIQEDISLKYLAERNQKYLSSFDQLTNVYNRKHAIEMIEKSLFRDIKASLIFFDIDDFSFINETYGNNMGDEVLKKTADFLKGKMGDFVDQNFILARMGEDNFLVFFEDQNKNTAYELAEIIRNEFFHLNFPSISNQLSISAGIVAYPDHGKVIDELLNSLDNCLFIAKSRGKNQCHLYDNNDIKSAQKLVRISQRERILKALEEDRFEPWYQPIFSFKEQKIHHFEVLARMRNEKGEIVLPGAFISAAEEYGLIGDIDKVIAEKAMKKLKNLNSKGKDVFFAMNLSGKEIEDLNQLEEIKKIINSTAVSPHNLIFEITETAAINDLNQAIIFIKELKKIGCSFSLDDFGVGFTSFTYLRDLDVDYLKIDGAFIRKIHENKLDQAIVQSMINVSKGFGIFTIAEFVENEVILKMLNNMSVDYAQGYYVGPPEPEPIFKIKF
jgi:diguanylate cyclase (GGDEF)-like protein/PAS domain S-box-containing protein